MKQFSVWTAALALAGMSTMAAAALPQAPALEQCTDVSGKEISVTGFTPPAAKSIDGYQQQMARLHDWLSSEAAAMPKSAGFGVLATRQDRFAIGDLSECLDCDPVDSQQQRRMLVGVGKPLDVLVDFSDLASSKALRGPVTRGGLRATDDGGFVWTSTVSSKGASALRLVFADMDLPDAAEIYVYNRHGEAFGPYRNQGMRNTGKLVSNTITGDTTFVQLRVFGPPSDADLAQLKFRIAEVAHIGSRFELARRVNPDLADQAKAFCSYNASCVVNGDCVGTGTWGPIDDVRKGVAHMLFPVGGSYYICSGGLINNTANDGRPLFLTANHCLSSQTSASGLETFFDFRESCNQTGACTESYASMRSNYPNVLGATLLATGKTGDFTLMELASVPSGDRHYMGFSTNAVASSGGFDLFRLSHPSGAPQAFSSHDVDANSFTCRGYPRGSYIYSADSSGATEGGSSGSPVLNASGQIVGQLFGACGSNLGDECDADSNRTMDGALAGYYASVESYLDPDGGGDPGDPGDPGGDITAGASSVSVSVRSFGPWEEGTASVSVVDQDGNPVANATVSGSWSGVVSGSGNGVTDGSGTASIKSSKTRSSGTFTFCVTGISGSGITWDGTGTCGSGS